MRAFRALVTMALVLAGGGCLETFDHDAVRKGAIEKRYEDKIAAWPVAHPGQEMTPADYDLLWLLAVKEEDDWYAAYRRAQNQEARDKLLEAGGHAGSGNYLAAGSALLMAVLVFLGIKKARTPTEGGTS